MIFIIEFCSCISRGRRTQKVKEKLEMSQQCLWLDMETLSKAVTLGGSPAKLVLGANTKSKKAPTLQHV